MRHYRRCIEHKHDREAERTKIKIVKIVRVLVLMQMIARMMV